MPKSNMTATKIKYSNLAVIIPLGSSLSLHIGPWQSKALIILFRKGKIHTSNYSQLRKALPSAFAKVDKQFEHSGKMALDHHQRCAKSQMASL